MPRIQNQPTDGRPNQPWAPPPFKGAKWSRWGLGALLVLAVVGFYILGLYRYFSWDFVRSNLDGWQATESENLVLSLAVFFLVYVTVTALSLPAAAILTMVAGALFGRWVGTSVASIASTLGATLAFLGSRYTVAGGKSASTTLRREDVGR